MSLSRFLAEIKSKIVDNLTIGGVDNILSAEQGKVLQGTKVAKAGDTMTGLLRATAGINFNASGGDTLSDYEVGTWTPIFTTSGTDFDSVSYVTADTGGLYQKIGDYVILSFRVRTSSVTIGSATGSISVGGFPFTTANASVQGSVGGGFVSRPGGNFITQGISFISSNVSFAFLLSENATALPASSAETTRNDVSGIIIYKTS
jgi:hypothetical protein